MAIASGSGKLHERRFNAKDTNELLRTAEPGTFLYQSTLKVSPAFYARYGIDPKRISVSENHPDLIAVLSDGAGGRLFRIMDVKRGEALRFTHRDLGGLRATSKIADQELGTITKCCSGFSYQMRFIAETLSECCGELPSKWVEVVLETEVSRFSGRVGLD